MTTAISIENLSKRYIIGHQRSERYATLRDVLMHKLRGFGQRFRHPLSVNAENTQLEEFWALQEINLEIAEGDCVGIIGRNGAGKSTLLKILSRITEPTTGRIRMRGRVASLLEVGTGFHPELSGRENIYLNGAILGMTRQEIKRKFDEIIAFAEVEKFLDTPVKRYSSGMYVRLAFAVAAHLEPEILIVDEVLAVGDAEFQKKCLGTMGEVAKGGRTVLFVSHNLGAVKTLCRQAILLQNGCVQQQGEVDTVVRAYAERVGETGSALEAINRQYRNAASSPEVMLSDIGIINGRGESSITPGDEVRIALSYEALEQVKGPAFVISFHSIEGTEILRLSTLPISGFPIDELKGKGTITLRLHDFPLLGGLYTLSVSVVKPGVRMLVNYPNVMRINVFESDVYHSGLVLNNSRGVIKVNHEWEHDR